LTKILLKAFLNSALDFGAYFTPIVSARLFDAKSASAALAASLKLTKP
jgi:hypothetical protein